MIPSGCSAFNCTVTIQLVTAGLLLALPVVVAASRLYRGMHHPSDVFFGGLMGVSALAIAVLAVRVASDDRSHSEEADSEPASRPTDQLPAVSA